MKLLFDMNLSPLWVEAVKAHGGHSALHWSEIGSLKAGALLAVEPERSRVRLLPFANKP